MQLISLTTFEKPYFHQLLCFKYQKSCFYVEIYNFKRHHNKQHEVLD